MLISISEVFETPVSTLLGKNISDSKVADLKVISEKLEILNLQLSQRKKQRKKIVHWLLISLCIIVVIIYISLILLDSPYLNWDYSKIEYAVLRTIYNSFEWLFSRIGPIIFIGLIVGILLTRNKD